MITYNNLSFIYGSLCFLGALTEMSLFRSRKGSSLLVEALDYTEAPDRGGKIIKPVSV